MKLQDQLCSLELAKRLKELGVKQKSLFWWTYYPATDGYALEFDNGSKKYGRLLDVSAFTVAELGEILPAWICLTESAGDTLTLTTDKGEGIGWGVWYEHTDHKKSMKPHADMNEANARAKMLIYLLENKLITI